MTLEISDVCVTYSTAKGGALEALRPVNVVIEKGEFVTIIGPSGCGKSTLLHSIGGLIRPTRGQISVDGRPVLAPDPRRAAFVFQDYALLPWKSVLDNAALGLRFTGVAKRERNARAAKYLEMVGLSESLQSYPRELSGGMQQRVSVARALSMDSEVLLLDEPFGALDEQSRRRLGVEMSELMSATGQTMLMVTHSLDETVFWADRILVMSARPGAVVADIRVHAPRPRDLSFMLTPEFESLRVQLFQMLETPVATSRADPERTSADA